MAIGSTTVTLRPEIDWKGFLASFSTAHLTRIVEAATEIVEERTADGVFD